MGRMYVVITPELAVTVGQDIMSIVSGANTSLILHSVSITQSSDPADAQAEMLRVIIKRGAAVGTGGAAITPVALNEGGATADATARRNDTTDGTGGTNIHEEAFNVQIGWFYRPTPEERITVGGNQTNSGRLTINVPDAPADSLDMICTAIFEEIG